MKTLRHAVAVLLAVFLALATAGAVVIFAMARKVVRPSEPMPDADILAVDTGAQTIELVRTPDTELPGRYGLFTTGTYGYVKLGSILSVDDKTVRRKLLTKVETGAKIDGKAMFNGWYYSSPSELHLPWEAVVVPSPVGPCPAWHFPARSNTWVIQVHGRGTTRAECLRAVPVIHSLGMPSLVVSYRNDGEAPRSRGGAYGLGSSEWEDVDAAIAWALDHGADSIVLMGWSMGGALSLQTVVSSAHHDKIVGLILESPVAEWRTVLRFHAAELGLKEPLPALAMGALSLPVTAQLSGADHPIPFDKLDMVARADELHVPILILHSDDDGFVPADGSYALAEARPDLVTMPHFTVARHTKLWNYDQSAWTNAITSWVSAQGFEAN